MRVVFGNEKIMFIALKPGLENGFNLDFFLKLTDLEAQINNRIPGVKNILSILNTPQTSGDCFGQSYFHKLSPDFNCESILDQYLVHLDCIRQKEKKSNKVEQENSISEKRCSPEILSLTESQLKQDMELKIAGIYQNLCDDPLIIDNLISKDHKTTAIIIQFSDTATPADSQTQEEIKKLIDTARNSEIEIAYASQARQEYEAAQVIRQDIRNILPLSLLIMVIVLFLSFRSFRGVIIPLSIVAVGMLWTFSIFALAGKTLNLVTIVLPPLLICVGSAYVIHLLAFYYRLAEEAKLSKEELIVKTVSQSSLPLVVTAMTTIVGFTALLVSPIPAIRDMGLFAGIGIAIIILLSLTLAPAMLTFSSVPEKSLLGKKRGFIDYILSVLVEYTGIYASRFIKFWLLIGCLALLGTLYLSVNSNTRNLAPDSSIMKELDFIEHNLGGTNSLRLILSGRKSPRNLQSAETIRGMKKLRDYLTRPETAEGLVKIEGLSIAKINSPVDYFELKHQKLDSLQDKDVPKLFERLKRSGLPNFLSFNGELMLMDLRMTVQGTAAILELKKELDQKIAEYLPQLSVRYTGEAFLASESAENIARGLVQSLLLALVIIFVLLSVMFLSPKMGIIALYPNIVSITIFFGLLGWLNIPIGLTISVIASIALGIGVDDTIHYLTHYNNYLKKFRNRQMAVREALSHTGKPMIYTTLSLSCGFFVFANSDMPALVYFGVLTAVTLLVCLVTDLNFLPSITTNARLITAWDYIWCPFHKTSIKGIDIFYGMSLREIKLLTIMSFTQQLKRGELLFEEGQFGYEMYTILDGEIEIYHDEKIHGIKSTLAQLGKGKIFGEMSLFRVAERTASASALRDTELLVVNKDVLQYLEKQYPRIATIFYMNLARNLVEIIKKSNFGFADKVIESDSLEAYLKEPESDRKMTLQIIQEFIDDGYITQKQKEELQKYVYGCYSLNNTECRMMRHLHRLVESGSIQSSGKHVRQILKNFTQNQFDFLKKNYQLQSFSPGSVVLPAQYQNSDTYLIIEGLCELQQAAASGTKVLARFSQGDLIADFAFNRFIDSQKTEIVAIKEMKILRLGSHGSTKALKKKSRVAANFFHNIVAQLSERIAELNKLHIKKTKMENE
ncbi:MMPL family transporter [candidate division CSSED10-310 bacterium]|uniref:MMPL family transporter n=1 Tax=candidate division CSSED10-310 bacterium TaxID=2855610 RepID=A0ABV6YTK5_UNCC1